MRIATLLSLATGLLLCRPAAGQTVSDPDPGRFAGEMAAFADWDAKNTPPTGAVLFVGSSSIRMWDTALAFDDIPVVNRGFGGAHLSDVMAWWDRTVEPYDPSAIVIYCGDNDVADGKPVDQVVADFERFVRRARESFGAVPIVYITIKPSVLRWSLRGSMAAVNEAVARLADADPALEVADIWSPMVETGMPPDPALFLEDGLHLSADGYAIWRGIVAAALRRLAE